VIGPGTVLSAQYVMIQSSIADLQAGQEIDPRLGIQKTIMRPSASKRDDDLRLRCGSREARGQKRPNKDEMANLHPDSPEQSFRRIIHHFAAARAAGLTGCAGGQSGTFFPQE